MSMSMESMEYTIVEITLEVTLEKSRSQRDRTPPSLFGL